MRFPNWNVCTQTLSKWQADESFKGKIFPDLCIPYELFPKIDLLDQLITSDMEASCIVSLSQSPMWPFIEDKEPP